MTRPKLEQPFSYLLPDGTEYRAGWSTVITDGPVSAVVVHVLTPVEVVFAQTLGELIPSAATADVFDTFIEADPDRYAFFEHEMLNRALTTILGDQDGPLLPEPVELRLPSWFRR